MTVTLQCGKAVRGRLLGCEAVSISIFIAAVTTYGIFEGLDFLPVTSHRSHGRTDRDQSKNNSGETLLT
jgi:hypothetical protein